MENKEQEFNKICRELLNEIEINYYSWAQSDIDDDQCRDVGISIYSLSKIIKKTPIEIYKYLRKLLSLGLISFGEMDFGYENIDKDMKTVACLSSLGTDIVFDEKMLDEFLPISEKESEINLKKEKLIFKDEQLHLGDKKCAIPKKSSHGKGKSYEYIILEFIYGKYNSDTDWNEIAEHIDPSIEFDNKIKKTIKDAIERINDRTKKNLGTKVIEYSSGDIKALFNQ